MVPGTLREVPITMSASKVKVRLEKDCPLQAAAYTAQAVFSGTRRLNG